MTDSALYDLWDRLVAVTKEREQIAAEAATIAGELRALADELDPPTEDTALAWDGGATDPRVIAQEAYDKGTPLAWDAERILTKPDVKVYRAAWDKRGVVPPPESVEYEPDLKDGRLTLRPTGRSWPAACEMCGAGNGQPCQAVSE